MTVIQSGSAAANKLFNAALFTQATRGNNFTNLMTDTSPTTYNANKADPSKQTQPGAPIVRVENLKKEKGDEVTMDLYHELQGRPTMGDKKLEGRSESLTSSQFSLKIQQGRHIVDSGGRMTQQRTKQNLVNIATAMLKPYYMKVADELTGIHLAGARGSDTNGWILPQSSDPEFSELLVNDVTPPTYDRHFYANDATALSNLDSTDKLSLKDIDRLRLMIDEMAFPLQPIRFKDDPQSEDNPFYLLAITPRQWHDLKTSAEGKTFEQLVANAYARSAGWKHPIFMGECWLYNNILIKKMKRPISFAAGETVSVCQNVNAATTTNVTCAVKTHRAMLLGAQALADAYGSAEGGLPFSNHSEKVDHDNAMEHSIAWVNGKKKIRFKDASGRVNDHGVIVIDSAVS
jgi:N4-gp56 family major capsid protein